MRLILLVIIVLAFSGCLTNPPMRTAPSVDLARYSGTWYEIASIPNSFQQGCVATTATYTLRPNGALAITNRCRDGSLTGAERVFEGDARVVDASTRSKLKVSFSWLSSGDYWIIARDNSYQYAVVGTPSREYLWILSRKPTLDSGIYNHLLSIAVQEGFDVSKIVRTVHGQ
jgi:apolipoprotein D and lipocalin family protein